MNDLVSIIIPTYNRASLIKECILSVHDQFYRPLEVLVVDDGSTDETEQVLKELESSLADSNFTLVYLKQTRKGAPAARNLGFLHSKGKYIQFLDSDDLLLPHKLRNEVNFLTKYNFDLVYSKAQYVEQDLTPIGNRYWGEPLSGTSDDYFKFSWQTMCALYKKEAIEKGGLWQEDLTINQDWEFSIRYILSDLKIGFLNDFNSFFRVHQHESIGKSIFSIHKIDGKVKSTLSVRQNVVYNNLLTDELDYKYFKRLVYCVLLYGAIKENKKKKDLIGYIKTIYPDISFLHNMLLTILNKGGKRISLTLLQLYNLI